MGKDIQEESEFRENREQRPDPHGSPQHSGADDLVLKRRGSVKQGWSLIIGAIVMVLFFAILPGVDGVLHWYYLVLYFGLASLAIAAGLKLIRGARGWPRNQK